ncbi:MAG TPA: Gfo/Idh/MocA family oxidoreductase [Planctomycetota bacterium]|jgi:predicted dehydrogenase|nr:Gfo/Idh/MocA family oxidoreductase [Planctomycetota bacterium]
MSPSRREFLRTSAALAGASLVLPKDAFSGRQAEEIRIGLIGCGGRGKGAAHDALKSHKGARLVAMGDAFADRLAEGIADLTKRHPDRVDVPTERAFVGFDAVEKVLAQDVDVVILATPPHFRPDHFKMAVAAGKHVFMEKPVAVDGYGVRTVLAAALEAKAKKLNVVVGLQRHYQNGYRAAMEHIHSGRIGMIVAARAYWNMGALWSRPRQPEWSDLEFQMRNWLYYAWLSGDHIVEQHVHNLDVINWAKRDYPVLALGVGGREVRKDPLFGHIYDHHGVHFQYADGSWLFSQCRQIPGCSNRVSEHVIGTQGTADFEGDSYRIRAHGFDVPLWEYEGPHNNPYRTEHEELLAAVAEGRHAYSDAENGARSTLTAIMGRMATYSGRDVTAEEALKAERLGPKEYAFGSAAFPGVAVPGV